MEFSWKLINDPQILQSYENDTRGIVNDFVDLAVFKLRTDVASVARFHAAFVVFCPLVAVGVDRFRAFMEESED